MSDPMTAEQEAAFKDRVVAVMNHFEASVMEVANAVEGDPEANTFRFLKEDGTVIVEDTLPNLEAAIAEPAADDAPAVVDPDAPIDPAHGEDEIVDKSVAEKAEAELPVEVATPETGRTSEPANA